MADRELPADSPPPRVTREEMLAYKARYAMVNEFEIEELRRTSPEVRLQQLWSMMEAMQQLGWDKGHEEETEIARARWLKLKNAYGNR